jgi:hypothetical protein
LKRGAGSCARLSCGRTCKATSKALGCQESKGDKGERHNKYAGIDII